MHENKKENEYYTAFTNGQDHPEMQILAPVDKKFVRAMNYMTGYIEKPIKNAKGETTGTFLSVFAQTDFGGLVPKWMVNKFAPSKIVLFLKELIAEAKKIPSDLR